MIDLLNVGRVQSRRLAAMLHFFVPHGALTWSFWRFTGGAIVNTFSSVKKMKSTALSGNLLNSFFARLKRVMQLASVSFCAWRFLTHFRSNTYQIICTTDGRWMPISLTICHVVWCVWGASSWLRTRSLTVLTFVTVWTVLGLLLPDFRVVELVSFKRLRKSFTLVFFQPLAGNSLISLLAS